MMSHHILVLCENLMQFMYTLASYNILVHVARNQLESMS